ncbi:GntR family transcriptional regulator [Streptosporangium amethystogenes]|uniref:GntR family transcriptional regulator n=1 Tax=Streptosporangium amethystogenes TaxID=2002 RepID=UPI000A07731A|nr:GntR family transcriptional regulator [Streptosporangium amethystogenes]
MPSHLRNQPVGIIAVKIKAGEYRPRQVLPSEARLQREHGVSRDAVRRAMRGLGEQGWAVTVQGRGRPTDQRGGGRLESRFVAPVESPSHRKPHDPGFPKETVTQ